VVEAVQTLCGSNVLQLLITRHPELVNPVKPKIVTTGTEVAGALDFEAIKADLKKIILDYLAQFNLHKSITELFTGEIDSVASNGVDYIKSQLKGNQRLEASSLEKFLRNAHLLDTKNTLPVVENLTTNFPETLLDGPSSVTSWGTQVVTMVKPEIETSEAACDGEVFFDEEPLPVLKNAAAVETRPVLDADSVTAESREVKNYFTVSLNGTNLKKLLKRTAITDPSINNHFGKIENEGVYNLKIVQSVSTLFRGDDLEVDPNTFEALKEQYAVNGVEVEVGEKPLETTAKTIKPKFSVAKFLRVISESVRNQRVGKIEKISSQAIADIENILKQMEGEEVDQDRLFKDLTLVLKRRKLSDNEAFVQFFEDSVMPLFDSWADNERDTLIKGLAKDLQPIAKDYYEKVNQ